MRSPLTTLCYVEKDDSYLMLHRVSKKHDVNKDKWIGIGGHFEEGESPEECLLREAMEETGVTEIRVISEDIFSLEILTVDGHEKRGVYVPSHLHLNVTYLLEADEAEVLRIKPDENSGVRWFSLEEALAACSEPWMIERVYKKLNAKVRERFGGTHGMQRGE